MPGATPGLTEDVAAASDESIRGATEARPTDLRRAFIACLLLCAAVAAAVGLGAAFRLSPKMWSGLAASMILAAGLLALLPQLRLRAIAGQVGRVGLLFGSLAASLWCGHLVASTAMPMWATAAALCAPTLVVAMLWPRQWGLVAIATALAWIGALPGMASTTAAPANAYAAALAGLVAIGLGAVYGARTAAVRQTSHASDASAVPPGEPEAKSNRPAAVVLELARVFALHERGAIGQVVVNETARVLGACGAILLMWDESAETYRVDAVTGSAPVDLDEVRQVELNPDWLPRGGHRDGAPVIAIEPSSVREPVLQSLMRRWHARSLHIVRCRRGAKTVGVLMVARSKARAAFSESDTEILAAMAPHASAALAHATLIADLQSANALKEEFMATMSHELRTPLNVIIGYTDMQIEGAFGDLDEEHNSTLQTVREQAIQLLELIQATLDMSRLERGLVSLDPADLVVAQMLGDLQKRIPPAWRKAAVGLEWKIEDDLPILRTDSHKLQILLRNLIHNAMKFTESGLVLVSAARHPSKQFVTFLVQDSGIGIKAEHLSQIFDMFRQAPDGESHSGGVGLGLYIVKRLAAALGAEIEVSSAPGRGATFRIHVPLVAADGAAVAAAAANVA